MKHVRSKNELFLKDVVSLDLTSLRNYINISKYSLLQLSTSMETRISIKIHLLFLSQCLKTFFKHI